MKAKELCAMNSYEEKKQRRIDYYNEKAEKLEQESGRLAKESSEMVSAIPPGQPLLVDHYSYKADKNYRDRAWNKMDKSVEVGKKADYYRSKAEAAEKNTAISSDDPDAVTKLKEKLQKLQDFQSYMKKVNAYYRKNGTMKGFEGISDEKAAEIDEAVKSGYSWETAPYAAYRLSNNNAEINRLKKRIASLERREETGFVGWQFEGGEAVANSEENRLQLIFDEKPTEEQRSKLKGWGFRWSPSNMAWQRQLNGNAIYAAGQIDFIRPLDGRTPRELQPKPKAKNEQER
ncbi:MAG: DUF3560 domain-containing protein [Clostridia bacterium]|nr:DUF3560 domain-containing protein [Clostridia bacterium]